MFNDFLHKEYGGPGTLPVEPLTDMLIALKERKLPGAPLAARTSMLWAQNKVDPDWEDSDFEPTQVTRLISSSRFIYLCLIVVMLC